MFILRSYSLNDFYSFWLGFEYFTLHVLQLQLLKGLFVVHPPERNLRIQRRVKPYLLVEPSDLTLKGRNRDVLDLPVLHLLIVKLVLQPVYELLNEVT